MTSHRNDNVVIAILLMYLVFVVLILHASFAHILVDAVQEAIL